MGFHGFHAATEFAPQLVHIAHIVKCFITVGMQSESKELEASLAITELVKKKKKKKNELVNISFFNIS